MRHLLVTTLACGALAAPCSSLGAQVQVAATADSSVHWRPAARFAGLAVGVPQQLSASVIVGIQHEWGAGTRQSTQLWYLRLEPGITATKVAIGVGMWRFADQGGGTTLQVAALRTYGTPWRAQTNSTYIGVEVRPFVWLTGPWIGYYQRQPNGAGPNNFLSFGMAVGF